MQLVDPNPRLAQFLADRGPKALPDDMHEWVVTWIADVGVIMRSRSFMAYTVASIVVNTVLGSVM